VLPVPKPLPNRKRAAVVATVVLPETDKSTRNVTTLGFGLKSVFLEAMQTLVLLDRANCNAPLVIEGAQLVLFPVEIWSN